MGALVFLAVTAMEITERVDLARNHATVLGTVMDATTHYRAPDEISVRFTTADGRQISTSFDASGPAVGDQVRIEYDTRDPENAKLAGSHYQDLSIALYAGLTAAFGYGIYRPTSSRRRPTG